MKNAHYKKLFALKCWPDVKLKLLAGEQASDIARFIQAGGELVEENWDSIARNVRRLRASKLIELYERTADLPQTVEAPGSAGSVPANLTEFMKLESPVLSGNADALFVMYSMLDLQIERVKRGHKLESDMGIPLPTMRAEVETLFTMLRETVEIEQSLGMRSTAPTKVMSLVGVIGGQAMQVGSGSPDMNQLGDSMMAELIQLENRLLLKSANAKQIVTQDQVTTG